MEPEGVRVLEGTALPEGVGLPASEMLGGTLRLAIAVSVGGATLGEARAPDGELSSERD